MVAYHDEAVVEFEELRDRRQRKGVLTIVATLRQIGPKLVEPHAKPVAGARGLRELRPGSGRIPVRPLYARLDERRFVIFAIAPEAQTDGRGFDHALARARQRAQRDYGLEL